MNSKYEDIINLPHHVSTKHPQMSMESRAAQFAPFAALTGYDEQIKETTRKTDRKIEIDDELRELLNKKLNILNENISTKPYIKVIYFVKDQRKTGGTYCEKKGNIRKIDIPNELIIFDDKTKIKLTDILDIDSEKTKNIE